MNLESMAEKLHATLIDCMNVAIKHHYDHHPISGGGNFELEHIKEAFREVHNDAIERAADKVDKLAMLRECMNSSKVAENIRSLKIGEKEGER